MAVPIDEGSDHVETSVHIDKKAGTHSQDQIMKCVNYRKDPKLSRIRANPTDYLPQSRYNRFFNIYPKLNFKTCLWVCLVLALRGSLATASELSFQWIHSTDSVTSTPRRPVTLEWISETNQNVESLRFTRYGKRSSTKVPVGEWTTKSGFTPDPFMSTILRLKVEQLPNSTVVKVSLTLVDPIYTDFDLYYNCDLSFGHEESKNNSIKLIMQIPKWTHSGNDVKAQVGQDAEFLWKYTYPFGSAAVITSKQVLNNTEDSVEIGYWYGGWFTTADKFMNRVTFSLTTQHNDDTEIISLKLKDLRTEDFGCYYICRLVLGDGEQTTNKTILIERVLPNTRSADESSTSSSCSTTLPVAVVVASIMFHLIKLWL
ncbi:hypothetical protein SNE40_002032 [Patella caerulea]|uniref:Uncharacterized protein n=1 Tax=Patella caerulea TaxID=87958 RepID=A0AAN8Q6Z9_PATCE